jgi:hypothetical protein
MVGQQLVTLDLDGVLCRPPLGFNPGSRMDKPRGAPGHKGLLWRTEAWRYHGRRPMPGAMQALSQLDAVADWLVLTARAEAARPLTEAWFRRHLGRVPEIRMRPHWRETSAAFKVRLIGELRPRAHFEDDPFTACWAADLGTAVFLIDWPRNRGLSHVRVTRVRDVGAAIPSLT